MTKLTASSSLAAVAALLLACGDDDDPAAPSTSAPDTSQPPAPLQLRVAHLSPDAPAVDLCLATAGTGSFTGPVLEQAGATEGLVYGQATRYLELDAGTYDVRIVAASATGCSTPAVPDTTGVTLEGGTTLTVAATGLVSPGAGEPGFALVPLLDETDVAAGMAKVRFVHASPGTPPVDVGAGSGDGFTPLFTAVEFPTIDDDLAPTGYLETPPLSDATLSARATGSTEDALVLEGVDLPAGAIVTVFATGLLGGDPPLAALVCADDPGETALLSQCAFAP